jgi:hypothetical protein
MAAHRTTTRLGRLLSGGGVAMLVAVAVWLGTGTDAGSDLAPYVGGLGIAGLVLGRWGTAAPGPSALGALGLSVAGLMLLNLSHHASRLPVVDMLRSAYWSAPLPLFLYRNTPLVLFATGVLVCIFAAPQRPHSSLLQRGLAVAGAGVTLLALWFPGALYVHQHESVEDPYDASAVPVMVEEHLLLRRWSRTHDIGRPMVLATPDKLRSDRALAQVTHGLAVATLTGFKQAEPPDDVPGSTRMGWLRALWTAQRGGSMVLVVARVALMPALLLVGFAGFAGTHRPAGALRTARRALGGVLLAPVLLNVAVLLQVAIARLGPAGQWGPELLWQAAFGAVVMVAWLAGDVLSRQRTSP